jgi:hypothetical protein
VPDFPAVAHDRFGVFGVDDARASGWTPSSLRQAIKSRRLVRLRPGAYWIPEEMPSQPDELRRRQIGIDVSGVLVRNPAAVASHTSAAVVHGLAVQWLPSIPCVTVPAGFVGDIAGAHLHRARLGESELCTARAASVTSLTRTIVDIGREHGVGAALVSADAALHQRLTTQTFLRDQVSDCAGWPGVRAARQAIECTDARAESPLESSSRLKLDGLVPPPEIQASVHARDGFLGRVDFLWPDCGVVGEADGLQKYDAEPEALREEKLRQERLEAVGLIVVRWGFRDLEDVGALVARLRNAFDRGRDHGDARSWTIQKMPRFSL